MRLQHIKLRSKRGFSIAEVLLAVGILGFALCGILATYLACFNLASISKNTNIATSAAQGIIEQIRATPFTTLWDTSLQKSQIELNGNFYNLTHVSGNRWSLTFMVNNMPANMGIAYIDIDNTTTPKILTATVSVCWKQGDKIIGEDVNLNGVLNAGEDTNGNGLIDSPMELITQIANR